MFQHLEPYAGDPILSLNEAYGHDPRPHRINLSIGIYFDDAGHIPVLDCVHKAEQQLLAENAAKPYLPIEGAPACRREVQRLLFGPGHEVLKSNRVATLQTVGSSGGLKFDAMLTALRALPRASIVLLHACCHNPTGVDLTRRQWDELIPVLREREVLPYLDLAYQGYGDGIDDDAFAVRALASAGLSFFVANSFSKSMSLYGERAGALSVVCPSAAEAELALGQLKATVRRNYSSPPIHAGLVVAKVLTEPALRAAWEADVAAMRERILAMRRSLHAVLAAKLPGRNFDYFLTQRGMFSYTGLTAAQVDRLREDHAVYLVRSGRMCIAGLNSRNVEPTAVAMAAVLAD